jgi:hypothetical protein
MASAYFYARGSRARRAQVKRHLEAARPGLGPPNRCLGMMTHDFSWLDDLEGAEDAEPAG